ncbi:hypothetical protein GCM10028813_15240 [Ramlibacter alkalitolerans]
MVRSAFQLSRLGTPRRASSSRMQWMSARLELALTVLKPTKVRANSRARGVAEGTGMRRIVPDIPHASGAPAG